ncbi:hypothetical protein [Rufibacter sp. XAAS-G3-1]|uniref:hypothetical protein n=1 Tax=Rufibacter sp. XAAS-G3-1 TaxID=2729134 RepID=UPI0015E79B41|nr:hypothetical protein [Rufibacter sp. XAAS-G3-1]
MKGLAILAAILLTVFYCLRFGYIWTAYGHGGQIIGIPFALIMIGLAISYSTSKKELRKEKLFYISIFYFLTLGSFSLTVEIIRNTVTDYFELLYLEPNVLVDKILLGFVLTGLVATVFKFRKINKREKVKRNTLANNGSCCTTPN